MNNKLAEDEENPLEIADVAVACDRSQLAPSPPFDSPAAEEGNAKAVRIGGLQHHLSRPEDLRQMEKYEIARRSAFSSSVFLSTGRLELAFTGNFFDESESGRNLLCAIAEVIERHKEVQER